MLTTTMASAIAIKASSQEHFTNKFECYNSNPDQKISSRGNPKQKAVLEALVAKIFASVTAIKAAYADLQMAQNPYNNGAVQAADEAIVEELRTLLELKRKFLKRDFDLSPLITLMLAEIQEQQSLMKTYEITINKLESDVEAEGSEVDSLHKQFKDRLALNKSLEKKLNASGPFVKLMIKEMELANWDLDTAAKAIESGPNISTLYERMKKKEMEVNKKNERKHRYFRFKLKEASAFPIQVERKEASALPIQVERKEASALPIQVERNEASTLPI
ncbi:Trehalose-phosphatase/synthase 7 isoform 1 [Hibiscus syriacus]|uniref:Trehalose-phosphatase/synthase 7 isoform 1 n=1 Tax=Hibiscus syriacus TaxID=106335 RepID=A0A6A2YAD9_HIBSY|nr:Trehalose-phosphatase/synthase 7 isoform 1 [Hibiscus syriacus]